MRRLLRISRHGFPKQGLFFRGMTICLTHGWGSFRRWMRFLASLTGPMARSGGSILFPRSALSFPRLVGRRGLRDALILSKTFIIRPSLWKRWFWRITLAWAFQGEGY